MSALTAFFLGLSLGLWLAFYVARRQETPQ